MDEFHRAGDLGSGNTDTGPGARSLHPLISWVQAGAWTEVGGAFTAGDAEALLPCPVRCSDETFVLRVRGESMEPRFRDGDLIFVDPAVSPDHGRFVVVRGEDSGEATFKQLIVEGDTQVSEGAESGLAGADHRKAIPPPAIGGVVVFKGEIV